MILVIDVGNTNMTLGVYEGKTLKATFRMTTKTPRTSDEYGVMITQLLQNKGIEAMALEGSIVASVVPDVMHSLMGGLVRYTGTKPMSVGPGIKTGIRIVTEDPRAIGADRIVDAVLSGQKRQSCLILRSGSPSPFWRRRLSQVCRPDWYTAKLARRNTLLKRLWTRAESPI